MPADPSNGIPDYFESGFFTLSAKIEISKIITFSKYKLNSLLTLIVFFAFVYARQTYFYIEVEKYTTKIMFFSRL